MYFLLASKVFENLINILNHYRIKLGYKISAISPFNCPCKLNFPIISYSRVGSVAINMMRCQGKSWAKTPDNTLQAFKKFLPRTVNSSQANSSSFSFFC